MSQSKGIERDVGVSDGSDNMMSGKWKGLTLVVLEP